MLCRNIYEYDLTHKEILYSVNSIIFLQNIKVKCILPMFMYKTVSLLLDLPKKN